MLRCSVEVRFVILSTRSPIISAGSAQFVVGTNDNPLLSRNICGLVSGTLERLTMLSVAHWRQFGLVQFSGLCPWCIRVVGLFIGGQGWRICVISGVLVAVVTLVR